MGSLHPLRLSGVSLSGLLICFYLTDTSWYYQYININTPLNQTQPGTGLKPLQVIAQAMDLLQHEVHIGLVDRCRRDDRAEEVGSPVVRLIAHHQGALLHHPALDDGADL